MPRMDASLPPLIQALLEPARYPGPVRQVTLVQTHISWVLLAGEFAYKIKKPLKLSFLDFSTLALRHASCEDELRLNRRLAPDLYLGVVGIFNTPDDPQWQGEGAPIEYAVKMRRFDEDARLDRVCARGELQAHHLSALADALTAFHAAAAPAPADSRFGEPAQVLAPALYNIESLGHNLPDPLWQARLHALQTWTQTQFDQLSPLLVARKRSGRVRECHGDLHLGNLVLLNDQVRLFDCIEFNDDFRWIDVASDIAFAYLDLLAHAQSGLATWLVDEYLSRSGDYEAAQVLRFYAVYRALVRAKVACIRAGQTPSKAAPALQEAQTYIALAERLTVPPPPRLLITHGLSGCGKSVASAALLQHDPQGATLRLRSDVQRKRLFGLASTAQSTGLLRASLYAPEAHGQTYAHLRQLAASLLQAGWSVVVDATFLKRADRDAFHALANKHGAVFGIVAPQAPLAVLQARIVARSALAQDPSEATLAVLAQQMQALEPLGADELLWVLPG
jgi:uncharacterized protein